MMEMHTQRERRGLPEELIGALAWFTRDVLRLERYFSRVTVKRRRNLARPIRRRRSAFRDPMICLDFLVMGWLGATRLSHIARHLRGRDALAPAVGLPRFCDHTTAHNFLSACHRTHVGQLAAANERLLRDHGAALTTRAPILDLDLARRAVRRTGQRQLVYQWAMAWCAGEGIAQSLAPCDGDGEDLVARVVGRARDALAGKPRLVRLKPSCVSLGRLAWLQRQSLEFVASATWPWALAQRPGHQPPLQWQGLAPDLRALDLGPAPAAAAPGLALRTILTERPPPAPGLGRDRVAVVTSLLGEPPGAVVRLATGGPTVRGFFGHRRWPLGDGKMPSADPRGNAAYLLLATMAMNVLRLFARHLGEGHSLAQVRSDLRMISSDGASAVATGSPRERRERTRREP